MAGSFKRTYRFALRSSLYISIGLTASTWAFLYLIDNLVWWYVTLFALASFALAFVIIQTRIEFFIYRRVKRIYDDVALLEDATLARNNVTTDMDTLTREVTRFARAKKIEIEGLRVQEDYRKDFMGNVAHELKTPLFTVQGYIDTLIDGAHKDKELRKKYLARASKGVDRLIYIVDDLDMITKLELGDLQLDTEDVDIVEIIQNVFDLLEMKASKKNIKLILDQEYPDPIMVHIDKDRIQQVIINLVMNSIKYGKQDGTTEISIEDLIRDKVIVRITDNGEGIAKEHIPRLFERFYRVDKTGNRKVGGSGLGLSIVKHILEAHNEKIYVDSAPGIGSEFSFTLDKASEIIEESEGE